MKLAKENLYEMAQKNDFMELHDIQVKIIGDLGLVDQSVRESMIEVQKLTETYKSLRLNICFSYNSSYEIN